jgi:hypothetical protein
MRLLIGDLSNSSILSGSLLGRQVLSRAIAEAHPSDQPYVVFLDFQGVAVATSSFLREAVFKFRDYARASLENAYPVVANANDDVIEELDMFAKRQKDAVWCCALEQSGQVLSARIVGHLDAKEAETLRFLTALGTASAPQLAVEHKGLGLGATAWNNRLAALSKRSLLIESKSGKTKMFTPVLARR